jgi:ATP-dependent RNA helicase DDX3X
MVARAEAKSRRETEQFFAYQRSMVRRGKVVRDDMYWAREERAVFKSAHVKAGINFSKYQDIKVETIGGNGTEEPIESFQDACDKFDFPDSLTATIEMCGYDVPTPVQKHAIPAVASGADVMVTAQTGSGKTAAFLIPIVFTALQQGPVPLKEGPVPVTSIVMAPTRELCQQIADEARRLVFKTTAKVCAIYGGAPAAPQLKQLAEGSDIIVATPGRLSDFMKRGVISVENVKFLALDEADRMLDMGFEPQIREIIEDYGMPEPGEGGRQTIMFSATFPEDMQNMALDFLDPVYMQINVGRVGVAAADVEQRFEDIGWGDKFESLIPALESVTGEDGAPKTIVFANMKNTVDNIVYHINRHSSMRAIGIHGDKMQRDRDRAIAEVKSGQSEVLVATEVAARGLDLPGIDHVINFDLPTGGDDYVHRIGRTGRIGNKGVATSFVGNQEPGLGSIVEALQEQAAKDPEGTQVPQWLEDRAFRR